MKNYYEILGVSPDATEEEIEKIANQELRRWNRRINAPSLEKRQEAERMIELYERILETLTNPQIRERYDQTIRVNQEETPSDITQNQSTNLPSTSPSQPTFPPETNQSETQKEQLPLVTVPPKANQEKPPFTTGPVKLEMQPEELPTDTIPTDPSPLPETPVAKEAAKSEVEAETTQQLTKEQEESKKVEKPKSSKGKVRIRKGWLWGISLIVVCAIGIVLYTLFNNASPLIVGQETNLKNKFIFKLESLSRENNTTQLQLSIRPADNKLEEYQNALKQVETVKEMINKGEIENNERAQGVVDRPLIEMTIRFEDAEKNSLGTIKTSDAQRITDQLSADEITETFKWNMSVFPQSTKYLVIESIQGMESDSELNNSDNRLLEARRVTYTINKRFILPTVQSK
jgi:curved DNA-binding protein CbpA